MQRTKGGPSASIGCVLTAAALAVGCGGKVLTIGQDGDGNGSPGGAGGNGSGDGVSGSSGPTDNCVVNADQYMYCYSYSNLPPNFSTEAVCPTGTVVPVCPTAHQTSCCEDIRAGGTTYSYGYCLYSTPPSSTSQLQSACAALHGTWIAN